MPETVAVEKPKTDKELMAELKAALDKGDFKAVAKISSEVAKREASKDKADREAKVAQLSAITGEVKSQFDALANKLVASKKLDFADGIWYSFDFGEKLTTCRLLKSQPKARTGGGGGKKFAVTTADLLEKYGNQKPGNGDKTYNQLWADTPATDGNARYAIRVKLLKVAGLS